MDDKSKIHKLFNKQAASTEAPWDVTKTYMAAPFGAPGYNVLLENVKTEPGSEMPGLSYLNLQCGAASEEEVETVSKSKKKKRNPPSRQRRLQDRAEARRLQNLEANRSGAAMVEEVETVSKSKKKKRNPPSRQRRLQDRAEARRLQNLEAKRSGYLESSEAALMPLNTQVVQRNSNPLIAVGNVKTEQVSGLSELFDVDQPVQRVTKYRGKRAGKLVAAREKRANRVPLSMPRAPIASSNVHAAQVSDVPEPSTYGQPAQRARKPRGKRAGKQVAARQTAAYEAAYLNHYFGI